MIKQLTHYLYSGFAVMRSNARILLVGVLVFVFPLLFVWVTQVFFDTAWNNIDRSQKQQVANIQTTLHEVVTSNGVNNNQILDQLAKSYVANSTTLEDVRVFQDTSEGLLIRYAIDSSLIGEFELDDQVNIFLGIDDGTNDSMVFNTTVNGERIKHTFRQVGYKGNQYVSYTKHNYAQEDNIMISRQRDAYFVLTPIFVFLIALAYWINRQTDWQKQSSVLKKKLDERGVFSNMIAHEFRTPLTAIKGYASFLEESKNLSDEEHRYTKNIRSSTERLVLLVNDFLEVARLQSGKIKLELQPIDLSSVIDRTIDDLTPIAKEKNLKLEFEKPKTKISLKTDENRLIQILTNIITNSLKYTDKGAVVVSVDEGYKKVSLVIKDTGMGISADDQKKLFAPFTRVGNVDQTSVTGTGLGMWITKQLVEFLGGTIGVESIRGVGTHIVITFKTD